MAAHVVAAARPATGATRRVFLNEAARNTASRFPRNAVSNTKYSLWSFVPRNLLEQFSRPMNSYFLVIALLQLVAEITPVNPLTTWLPLAVLFTVTAVKEGVDDVRRWRADRQANLRPCTVARGGRRVTVPAQDISVGDVVWLREGDELPCDVVVLATSEARGACLVQTTNVDGETNLKPRTAPLQTQRASTDAAIGALRGVIECPPPNEHIHSFDARLWLGSDVTPLPLTASQLLLQATHLRCTAWVYGVAVYTGNETKLGCNKKKPVTKVTQSDYFINRVSVGIFVFQLLLAAVLGAIGNSWQTNNGGGAWYLRITTSPSWYAPLIIPARFLLLNSTMIPISLKLTMDLCKLAYARYIDRDVAMLDAASGTGAVCNSTSLSEDLGQVQCLLTDKTGTLTQNRMVVKTLFVGSRQFDAAAAPGGTTRVESAAVDAFACPALTDVVAALDADALAALRCIALNNDVIPVAAAGKTTYKAASPDEEALVSAAHAVGVSLISREDDSATLDVLGARERHTIVLVMPFTSERKRMTVLVRAPDGSHALFCKGADDVIMRRIAADQRGAAIHMQRCIDALASTGLRTLVFAWRPLGHDEAARLVRDVEAASTVMVDRDGARDRAFDAAETDLLLLGASGIEDKLQEGVPETLAMLRQAGVQTWMLTGDKLSTALSIARSCGLHGPQSVEVVIEGANPRAAEASLRAARERAVALGHTPAAPTAGGAVQTARLWCRARLARGGAAHGDSHGASGMLNPLRAWESRSQQPTPSPTTFTLVVEGSTLSHIAPLPASAALLAELCGVADAVVCCRVAPKQKAEMVRLAQRAGRVTLAIGDGGNDVAMIQEAAVGVGIRGKEGLHAARASDYHVPSFASLQRLMFVHGRYSYYRTSIVAQYSFYKSFLFCIMQVGYAFASGFSGVSLFNSLCVSAYNVLLFPPIVLFVTDRDITQASALSVPQAYRLCNGGTLLTAGSVGSWLWRGLWQAVVILLGGLFGAGASWSGDYESMGLLIYFGFTWVQDFSMLFALRRITWINVVATFGMHAFSLASMLGANTNFGLHGFIDYGSLTHAVGDPAFWLLHLLVTVSCVAPVEVWHCWSHAFSDAFPHRLARWDVGTSLAVPLARQRARKAGLRAEAAVGVASSPTRSAVVELPVARHAHGSADGDPRAERAPETPA